MTKRKFIHPECLSEFLKVYRNLQIKNPSLSENETWDYASDILFVRQEADRELFRATYGI